MTTDPTPPNTGNGTYRLLGRNDIIEIDDEWLDDDCERWHRTRDYWITKIMVGQQYKPDNYVPFRRLREQE